MRVRWVFFDGKEDTKGNLYYWDKKKIFPDGIKRCFWTKDVSEGTVRGNHAHKEESQVLISIQGKVQVRITTLQGESFIFDLDSPAKGLLIPPLHWAETRFSENGILLVLSDREFSEADYIRDLKEFEKLRNGNL